MTAEGSLARRFRRRLRHVVGGVCALLACVLGFGSVAWLVSPEAAFGLKFHLGIWGAVHVGGALVACCTARVLAPLEGVDLVAILASGLFLPVFGPAIAWSFVRDVPTAGGVKNAHAHFEAEEDDADETYTRSGLTGEFDVDLARETSAVSYAQILRQGTLQRRRNLLRSLARIGSPEHVSIIRRCLYDDEPELRLCAHGELDKLARKHEEGIADLRAKLQPEVDDGSPALPGNVARSCREYAKSGIFDEEMSEFWMMQAERYAAKARQRAPTVGTWVRLHTEVLIELNEFDVATDVLGTLPDDDSDLATGMLRAELAFVERDLSRIREIAKSFEDQFAPVPTWIAAILGRVPVAAGSGGVAASPDLVSSRGRV